jgi:hypothetical protein
VLKIKYTTSRIQYARTHLKTIGYCIGYVKLFLNWRGGGATALLNKTAHLPNSSTSLSTEITPDGLVVFRFKREPQIPREPLQKMNRAMTFTGFMPNGGMTAFSAAADSYQPRPSWYSKPIGPADTLTPPMESDQPAQPEQEEPMWAKKPKKKPYHPSKYYPSQTTQDEDEEEYEAPSRSKSSKYRYICLL